MARGNKVMSASLPVYGKPKPRKAPRRTAKNQRLRIADLIHNYCRTRRCFMCDRRGWCIHREPEILRAVADAALGKEQ
jgi:hypothetical protein